MLAVAYERTQELAKDLRAVGCGDLDVEGHFVFIVILSDGSFVSSCKLFVGADKSLF